MGLSDYPSNSRKRLEGIAVGLFVRYPLDTFMCRVNQRQTIGKESRNRPSSSPV